MLVHALHESVMSGLTHEPGRVAELHRQKISLGVEPEIWHDPAGFSPEFRENHYLRPLLNDWNDWNVLNNWNEPLSMELTSKI